MQCAEESVCRTVQPFRVELRLVADGRTDGRTGGHEATDDTALAQRRMSKQVRVEPHPSALAVTLPALLLLLLFFITPYTAAHKHTNTKKS